MTPTSIGTDAKDSSHKILLPGLVKVLKRLDGEGIMVVGGVTPAQDYDYGQGTLIPVAAQKVIEELDGRHG